MKILATIITTMLLLAIIAVVAIHKQIMKR